MDTKINFRNYIGTKSLLAFPMTKGDYCKLRNWDLPFNEEPEEDGYLVEYPDSLSNHPDFRGYISWSPKAVLKQHIIATQKAVPLVRLSNYLNPATNYPAKAGMVKVCSCAWCQANSTTSLAALLVIWSWRPGLA